MRHRQEYSMSVIDDADAIAQVIQLYIEGSRDGDAGKLHRAFVPEARMYGIFNGERVDLPIQQFFDLAASRPANSAGNYRARIVSIDQALDVATVRLAEDGYWGAVSFIDFLALAKINGAWKIVNKTFAHTGGAPD
jgi:hypothetical protein